MAKEKTFLDNASEFISKNKGGVIGLAVGGVIAAVTHGMGGGFLAWLLPVVGLFAGSLIGDSDGAVRGLAHNLGGDVKKKGDNARESDVREREMLSPDKMQLLIKKIGAQDATQVLSQDERGQHILEGYDKLVKEMKIDSPPRLLIAGGKLFGGNALTMADQADNVYIFLGKNLYENQGAQGLSEKQVLAVLGHELAHVKNRDVFVDGIAKEYDVGDKIKFEREKEFRADLTDVQTTHDYKSLPEALKKIEVINEKNSDHPSNAARIQYIHDNDPGVKVPKTPAIAKRSEDKRAGKNPQTLS